MPSYTYTRILASENAIIKKEYTGGGIYSITNLTNKKRYIGSTVSFKNRFYVHRSKLKCNKHSNQYLQNAWNKYGKQNFQFEILENIQNKNLLQYKESYWINELDTFYNGYNIRLETNQAHQFTKETKVKMSKKRKEYFKTHFSYFKGKKFTKEHRENLSKATKLYFKTHVSIWKGKKLSKTRKNQISETLKAFYKYKTHSKAIAVVQFTKDCEFMHEFKTAYRAHQETSINNIIMCCKGRIKSAGGYIWKYKEAINSELYVR